MVALPAQLDLSLIIACYNEEPHLRSSVMEIVHVMAQSNLFYELIFVEDHSPDGTARVLGDLVSELAQSHPQVPVTVMLHERNQGRGATVRDGMRAAKGRVMGFIDVDLEVHCRYIPDMVRAVDNGFDVATGFRVYHVDGTNLGRHFLSVGYRMLMRQALATALKDTETGYKFFNRARCAKIIEDTQTQGWFWDTEVMLLAERSHLRITEIPVAFVRRLDKASTVRVIPDSVDYARRLVEFRLRLLRQHGRTPAGGPQAQFGSIRPVDPAATGDAQRPN